MLPDPDTSFLLGIYFTPSGEVWAIPGELFGPEHVDLMVETVAAAQVYWDRHDHAVA